MQDRALLIEHRIRDAYAPAKLEVINDSDQHQGHAGHGGGNRHFTVIISTECFAGDNRINIHRKIYALFQDMMPEQIHALVIKLLS